MHAFEIVQIQVHIYHGQVGGWPDSSTTDHARVQCNDIDGRARESTHVEHDIGPLRLRPSRPTTTADGQRASRNQLHLCNTFANEDPHVLHPSRPMNVRDLAGTGRSDDLLQLIDLHRRWFPGYEFCIPELEAAAELPSHRGDRVVHLPFASIEGRGVGYSYLHANLNRGIAVQHFMAIDSEFRGRRESGPTVAEAILAKGAELVIEDGRIAGRPVEFGIAGETAPSEPGILSALARLGFLFFEEVDYAEPDFGPDWAAHGEPKFTDLILIIKPFGGDLPRPSEAVQAACEALLLDYYHLDPEHPRVASILSRSIVELR